MYRRILTLLILAILGANAQTSCFLTPLLGRAESPQVDGVIRSGEWARTVQLCGFLAAPDQKLMPGGEGTVNLSCDGRTLFMAVRMPTPHEAPGGGLRSDVIKRDGPVYLDDCIDWVLVPDSAENQLMYHFVFNANGAVYDQRRSNDGKHWDAGWNCPGLTVASKVTTGWWELEVGIPLASLNSPVQGVKMNVCRTFAGIGPSAILASSRYVAGPFFNLKWGKDYPAIQMKSIGMPSKGIWTPSVRIGWSPAGKKYAADMEIREWRYQSSGQVGIPVFLKNAPLETGRELSGDYRTLSRKKHSLEINVRDGDNGNLLFTRTFSAQRGIQTDGVPPTAEFDIPGAGTGCVFSYPGMNCARINLTTLPEVEIKAVILSLGETEKTMEHRGGAFTLLMSVPPTPGRYPLNVRITYADGRSKVYPAVYVLKKKAYSWKGNALGKARIVLPPFTPVAAEGKGSLEVLHRIYRFNGAGLPASIRSLDREIMAGEAYYEMEELGKMTRFAVSASPVIRIQQNGCQAEISGTASADGVQVKSSGRFEYDGFLWNTIEIRGQKQRTIDAFRLVIPLRDNQVPLFHAVATDVIRFNPTGCLPAGEGVIWDSTRLKRDSYYSDKDKFYALQAVPYIWLGAEKRGLSWFINSTCGMKLDDRKSALRLIRRKGCLRLEIDFINRPAVLPEGHRLAYGIQATPVKNIDPALSRHWQTDRVEHPRNMISRVYTSSDSGEMGGWSPGPWKNDWRLFTAKFKLLNTGRGQEEFHREINRWLKVYDRDLLEYCKGKHKVGKQTHYEWRKSLLCGRNMLYVKNLREPVANLRYTDPTLIWRNADVLEDFKSEWISRRTGYFMAERTFLTPSSIDFLLDAYHQLFSHGLRGIYFDDMFPTHCRNADTCARYDDEGRLHGNFGILEMRELVKRTAVMMHEMGISPILIQIHMTNCLLAPCFAFATSQLSWEDHYGETWFQNRFAVDYIRTESLGTQIGLEPVTLCGIYRRTTPREKWDERFRALTRSHLAMTLPGGIKIFRQLCGGSHEGLHAETLFGICNILGDFRGWEKECRFVPFYEKNTAVSGVPEQVMAAYYQRPDRTLIILGNTTGRKQIFKLKIDSAKLGLTGDCMMQDAESGRKIQNGQVVLKGNDLALILVSGPAK